MHFPVTAFSNRKKKEKIINKYTYKRYTHNAIISLVVREEKLGSPYIITSSPTLICNSGIKFKSSFKVFLLAGARASNVYKCFSILQNCADLLNSLIHETGLKLLLHYENSMGHITAAKLETSHCLGGIHGQNLLPIFGKGKI